MIDLEALSRLNAISIRLTKIVSNKLHKNKLHKKGNDYFTLSLSHNNNIAHPSSTAWLKYTRTKDLFHYAQLLVNMAVKLVSLLHTSTTSYNHSPS